MRTLSFAHPRPELTGTCPTCSGTFETCRCGARPSSAVRAGIIDDIEREDNKKGFEPDDLVAFHALVAHLTADGDRRAALVGRRARRTLAEMAGR